MSYGKKSQATLFIFIAVIILFVFSAIFFLNFSEKENELEVEDTAKSSSWYQLIDNYLETYIINGYHYGLAKSIAKINGTCTSILQECGISQGGYMEQPDPYLDIDIVPVPLTHSYGWYAFDEDSIDSIKPNIESFMDRYIDNMSLSVFESQGFSFRKGNASTSIEILDYMVIIDVNLSLEIRKEDKFTRKEKLHYVVNDRLGWFLREVKRIINDSNESDTANLDYDIVEHDSLQISRLPGADESHDFITVADPEIKLIDDILWLRFTRENRPSDANTVFLTSGEIPVSYVHYNKSLTINCPNYKTSSEFADPDEDDKYNNLEYNFEGLDYDFSACGNSVLSKTVKLSGDGSDVCSDLTITITDPGGLKDQRYFENVIRCSANGDKNGCCGNDGCWLEGQGGGCSYGKCLWTVVSECTYKICPAGTCGKGKEIEMTAITKEQQFGDMCSSSGDCICSGRLNPRYKTYPCPQNEECPDCPSGGGNEPNAPSPGDDPTI